MAATTASAWSKPGAWALDSEQNDAELNEHSPPADFPPLAAAAAAKTKKKKPQTLSLQEFSSYKPPADEVLFLPTGPRQRSAEELDRTKLGGGFRSYGGGGGAREEQPRRQASFNRDSNPSRADETDDWGAGKKFSSNLGFDRKERGERGAFSGDSPSRADDVDDWTFKKSLAPSSEPRRYGADSSNWVKKKEEEERKIGGAFDSLRDRRGGGGFESNRREDESGGGIRPRLNLQPRTLPVGEGEKNESVSVVKAKGSSPFGAARPREEVLKEKGQDWKEIEEKIESVKIKEEVVDSDVGKRSFWGGNGRERLEKEDKFARPWRRLELDGSRPESAGETEDGSAENIENGNGVDQKERALDVMVN